MKKKVDQLQRGKRTKDMEKAYLGMLKKLDDIYGEVNAGMLIMLLVETSKKMLGSKQLETRSLEIKINDFFSAKWDFEKGDFVDE